MRIKKNRSLLILGLAFLLLPIVFSQEQTANVLLTLKDINTNENIDSVVVTLNIKDNAINRYIENSNLSIKLNNGNYEAIFKVDDLITDGKDYYGRDMLIVENNLIRNIFLYPVGSIRGIVKDKFDNVVGNAKLKFECSGADIIDFPETSDKFGSFSLEYIPIGNCKIFANYKSGVGIVDIEIEKGSLNDIEVKIDTSIVTSSKNYIWLTVLVLLLIVIIAIVFYKYKSKVKSIIKKDKSDGIDKKEEKDTKVVKSELRLGKRAKDVLEILNNREREVADFIIEKGGKTSQSKIYYGTGIPKVSLSRYVQSLEQKKVIEVKKIGKINEIKLSEWFLGEDKEMEQS